MRRPGLVRAALRLGAAVLLASCAAPPLAVYTLGDAAVNAQGTAPGGAVDASPLGRRALVVEVARVSLPDDLDTQDIQVRHGNVLQPSRRGRWASRLSVAATGLLTARLARRRPDALFTDQPQAGTPSDRVLVNISRLDVTAEGTATLEADWQIVPRDPARPARRNRANVSAAGPVATDADVVALVRAVLDQLAARIDVAGLR